MCIRDSAEPVDLSFPAMCLSLGRGMGIFQFARKDDTAMGLYVGGRAGAKLKEMSCAFSVKHLVKEARKPGAHHWPKGEHRRRVLRAEEDRTPAA